MKMTKKATFSKEIKRKAISYIRFSTLAQGNEGRDSTQRQKDALNAALARWNLELDATYSDKGKSGYHQNHVAKGGAMHELRKLAINGKLRGKVLIVEDFDRMGRMQCERLALHFHSAHYQKPRRSRLLPQHGTQNFPRPDCRKRFFPRQQNTQRTHPFFRTQS